MQAFLGLLIVVLSLSGCVTTESVISQDKYTGNRYVESSSINVYNKLFSSATGRLRYVNEQYELRVSYIGYQWAFFENATVMGGDKPQVRKIDRRVIGGSPTMIEETVSISLNKSQLSKAAAEGLEIRLEGQRGSIELSIQGEQVVKFVLKVEEYNRGIKS